MTQRQQVVALLGPSAAGKSHVHRCPVSAIFWSGDRSRSTAAWLGRVAANEVILVLIEVETATSAETTVTIVIGEADNDSRFVAGAAITIGRVVLQIFAEERLYELGAKYLRPAGI